MLYLVETDLHFKIGYTDDPYTRESEYKTHNPICRFNDFSRGTRAEEKIIHKALGRVHKVSKEWFEKFEGWRSVLNSLVTEYPASVRKDIDIDAVSKLCDSRVPLRILPLIKGLIQLPLSEDGYVLNIHGDKLEINNAWESFSKLGVSFNHSEAMSLFFNYENKRYYDLECIKDEDNVSKFYFKKLSSPDWEYVGNIHPSYENETM